MLLLASSITCLLGKLKTEFTIPIAKSISPGATGHYFLCTLQKYSTFSPVDDAGNPEEVMSEYYAKFRRGDMNLDDKLDESEFLYFQHPEHNPQSTKDLVEDMIENFDRNQDKVNCQQHGLILD